MIHVPRTVTATLAALALAAGLPGLAHGAPRPATGQQSHDRIPTTATVGADGQLPTGWRLTGQGADRQLVWRAHEPVPMGDARLTFHAGDRLLGAPVADADGKTFRLAIGDQRLTAGTELQARAGTRRVDAAAPARTPAKGTPRASAQPPAQAPANAVDPGKPGRFHTARGEYALKSVRLPDFPEPVEMRATVVGPTDAPGRRPLALFLHGRHITCYGTTGEDITGDWPCAAGAKQVPSYRGYLRAQQLLASQGYVTVSISANGINGQDFAAEDGGAQARSSLVRQHLAHWADWAGKPKGTPGAVRAVAPADLSKVLLVGHSRGGEGVNRAAMDSLTKPPAAQDGYRGPVRWRIRGNVLIGPTIFGHNPVPDVPSATILPGCDGDVSDLQGQIYTDGTRGVSRGAALHSSLYVVGANHNFFNTEWTPGQSEAPSDDDYFPGEGPNRVCSPGTKTRLSATQQQVAGAVYIAAAARLFVAGDDKVRPLLDGSHRSAPSAGPARVLSHAIGGNRKPLVAPSPALSVSGGRVCAQVSQDEAQACLVENETDYSPHFVSWQVAADPDRHAIDARWSKAGKPIGIGLPKPVSVTGSTALALRVIVPPNTKGTKLDVAVTDAAGRRAVLGQVQVDGLASHQQMSAHWGQEVRVSLSAASKARVDLARVKKLELTPRSGAGRVWLLDAWGWRAGTPAVTPVSLPRVDVGLAEVPEGNSGQRTHRVPIRVSGSGTAQVRVFQHDPFTDKESQRLVTLRPGTHSIDLPVKVTGNTRYGYDYRHPVSVKAIRGAVVGADSGGLLVRNDDPMPKVTVEPIKDSVTEGEALSWRVRISQVADAEIWSVLMAQKPAKGTELASDDVDRKWFEETFFEDPTPVRPLSQASQPPSISAAVEGGELTRVVTVPTVKDKVAESEEVLQVQLVTYDNDGKELKGPVLTGRVRDAS